MQPLSYPIFGMIRDRFRQPVFCGAAVLLLCGLCLQSSKAQQPVLPMPSGTDHRNSASFEKPPDIPTPLDDPQEAIRKGSLFYAISPRPEKELEQLGVTSAPFSISIPLEVNQVEGTISVSAEIDDHKVHLNLDTGGGPGVMLNKKAVKGLKLQGQRSLTIRGVQGEELATMGLCNHLTLGKLTLQSISTILVNDSQFCLLGMPALERYRITLDFVARTMTLSRGDCPIAVSVNGSSLSVPFRYEEGKIYLPVLILNQPTWALLDSGSGDNVLSLKVAKLAAAQIPVAWSETAVTDAKFGIGNTDKSATMLGFAVPVPILLQADQSHRQHDNFSFGTVSQVGLSAIDTQGNSQSDVPLDVILGLPFLLQFRRVIIDYPNRLLILEKPQHGAKVEKAKMFASLPNPGQSWPGYHWRPVGDGWVEVPDKTAVDVPRTPSPTAISFGPVSSGGTTITVDASVGSTVVVDPSGGVTIVVSSSTQPPTSLQTKTTVTTAPQSGQGNTVVIINGSRYEYPHGSTLRVDADGRAHIISPTDINTNNQK